MKLKKFFRYFFSYVFPVILGNFLYAFTVKLFLFSSDMVTGGTTGIALTLNHFFGISVTGFVFVFNFILLVISYFTLGKHFAATTLASTFLYPFFLELCSHLPDSFMLTDDIVLCTVFAGFGLGIALGIVIRTGASTGGMDIPPLLLHKYCRVPVSVGLYGFDVAILLSQAMFQNIEKLLYGIIMILIYTIVLDKMLLIGTTRTQVKIISKKSDEIREAILRQVDRGVTMVKSESGYLREETSMVLTVVTSRELPKVERVARNIDPDSFVIISRVNEVRGRGFSTNKEYK